MTHRSQELKGDLRKLLIHSRVHSAAVTMVTRLALPLKPRRTLAEFRSQRQKRGGLAWVPLELWVPGEQRMWKTAWGDAIGLYKPVGGAMVKPSKGNFWFLRRVNGHTSQKNFQL